MNNMSQSRTKIRRSKSVSRSNISDWLKRESPHKRRALETASRHFDRDDDMDVHTLEAVYAQESSFGLKRGKRNSDGAAGDFQIRKSTARDLGLKVSEANDERFDVDATSAAAAKYLKTSDDHFRKATTLSGDIRTAPIVDPSERKNFVLAAYNAGDARIAKAQKLALEAGDDPTKWNDVEKYLEEAGATKNQAAETRTYVNSVSSHEQDFDKKSKADAKEKYKKGTPVDPYPSGGHWITKDGRHIFIKD